MAQHDYIISNQTFPNTRADINNVLSAIASNNSGTSAPTTQYAGQFWIDTTSSNWVLYIHDGSDDIQFATIDTSANTVNFTDSALDVVTDTTPQLGGNLDLNSNNITGTGNINITGTGTFSGDLTVDTNTLFVNSSNNRVGIGTSSPLARLQVSTPGSSGTEIAARFSSASDAIGAKIERSGSSWRIASQANLFLGADYDSNSVSADSNIIFETEATERMRIDSLGRILIGTTSDDPYNSSTESGQVFGTLGSLQLSNDDNGSAGNAALYINQVNTPATNTKSVRFFHEGTEVGVIDTSSTGIGIRLGGTGTANRLDDYEEGTFTPFILGLTTAGVGTYSLQSGRYTKIGNTVTVTGKLAWSAHTGTGLMKMGGLPFTSINESNNSSCFALAEVGNITITANNILTLNTINNTTEALFGRTPVGGGGDGAVTLDTAGYFRFSTTYFVN